MCEGPGDQYIGGVGLHDGTGDRTWLAVLEGLDREGHPQRTGVTQSVTQVGPNGRYAAC